MTLNIRNNRLTVYGDLNCPFCYALHENLREMNYLSRVTWKCIEHAPQINFATHDFETINELKTEVAKVKTLAPDVVINIPRGRVNTHYANEVLTELQQQLPKRADAFRSRLYRAFWVDGKDIAEHAVIDEILRSLDIELPKITQTTHEQLQQWQQEWEEGDFSRNIPALITDDANKLLGFPSQQLLTLFIYGDSANFSTENDGVCTLHPCENILISSTDNTLINNISASLSHYEIKQCTDNGAIIDLCRANNPPDLIFLDAQSGGYETCQNINAHMTNILIPVVLLTDTRDDDMEVRAFELGAADFIHKNTSPSVLQARARTLLRLKRANDLLDEVAHMDPLTEIPNRREYNRVMDLEWRQCIRTQKPLSIIFLDIDFFKNYNDNYGHIEGDRCLRSFAHFLQCNMRRPTDLVARYGGEEFVILLPDANEAGALKVAELVKQKLSEQNLPHAFSAVSEQLTVSQGVVSCVPTPDDTPNALIKAADAALYKAKKSGRNNIVCINSLG